MNREVWSAIDLLEGAYDLHIHGFPSHVARELDDFEIMEQAACAGMAGVVLKNHYESTAGRAELVNKRCGFRTRAYGGLVLNWPAGGINPYAVESALRLGAKFIWLPTRDAANCLTFGNMPGDFFDRPGIHILKEDGKLIPEVYAVLEVIRSYDAVFCTGHISLAESIVACGVAREMGIKTVLTHPEWTRTKVPAGIQAELAEAGVYIEKDWANIANGECTEEEMLTNMEAVGASHIFLATDRGQKGVETPVEGLARFALFLLKKGYRVEELRTMLCDVPAEIVGR